MSGAHKAKDSAFSVEALTEILTHFSGVDRQMLTRIVQRWGRLSEELKRAVLRVKGRVTTRTKSGIYLQTLIYFLWEK